MTDANQRTMEGRQPLHCKSVIGRLGWKALVDKGWGERHQEHQRDKGHHITQKKLVIREYIVTTSGFFLKHQIL